MTNLYLNDELVDLQGNEVIATDYEIAPLSDISKRGGAKSVSFRLPMTANNKDIIENAHVIVNGSRAPYSLLKARLDVNGVDQLIRFAELEEIKDEISIRLLGSNIDFFSIIKGRKLADLNLNTYGHLRTYANIKASLSNTSGYIYPIMDTYSEVNNAYFTNSNDAVNVKYLVPAFFLYTLIDEIITEAGFTSSGDFLGDADYRNIIIPIEEYRFSKVFIEEDVTYNASDTIGTLIITSSADDVVLKSGAKVTITNNTDPTEFLIAVTTSDLSVRAGVLERIQWSVTSNNVITWNDPLNIFEGFIANNYTVAIEFNLTGANEAYTQVIWYDGVVTAINAKPLWQHSWNGGYGDYVDMAASLPDFKQSDLLKAIAQKFALFINVDNQNKVVEFRQFSEIIDNIPNAKDWSDKVDYTEKYSIAFRSSYARLNNCLYEDDETVIKPTGTDAVIEIDDNNLEAENDLFESPFAASESATKLKGKQVNKIKYYTGAGTADEEFNTVEPRILVVRRLAFSAFELNEGGAAVDLILEAPLTHFISQDQDFNLGWGDNLLDNAYTEIIAALQSFKIVTLPLRLTATDINQLDFFTPVWIEIKGQPGAYFYISKIKQFKSTSVESTDVELVKLT